MDWVRDTLGLHGSDLDRVFKYEPKATTVLCINDQAIVHEIETHEEWQTWLEQDCPSPKDCESGLVVLFAKRSTESSTSNAKQTSENIFLAGMDGEQPVQENSVQSSCPPDIKTRNHSDEKQDSSSAVARHSLRTIPLSRSTFEIIARAFYMHSSISRVISRADIPAFTHTKATMEDEHGSKHEVSVFNLRTSNAWPMDLALTVTYFPHCNLMFAFIFGCDLEIEEEILSRLRLAGNTATHPLLLPGIIVEIERRRHVQIVDDIVDEVEARIYQLEIRPGTEESMTTSQIEKLHKDKRSAWLNITYTRNCLQSWRKQLENIALHVDEVNRLLLGGYGWSSNLTTPPPTPNSYEEYPLIGKEEIPIALVQPLPEHSALCHEKSSNIYLVVGYQIKSRTLAIIEEYDDKIRECSLRIEGMAMATQWAQGETSLEIAKATRRDSEHMRSIALVTMIFLPGTFFAGVFSMTFFDWSGNSGQPVVSKYIWIYVLFTLLVTLITIGLWYYFNIYRRQWLTSNTSTV
ncbi:hypothetical protein F5B22DRAFT_622347 [Xylaria bambusicola]|uniref:uncharacterized protein n=1 Tax=Xylaria bambusicola TaxID=326684 RepID=UPI0020075497|nr:uncharacterized protein F5B22DRAFT_622347 [Xylaria bambusicola]KAI0506868.1 hypothetical protein F5B22DRAFT_622347 [Xylaria bambusicola]